MFLKNCWYVAAYSSELGEREVLGRTLLNQPVAMFRTSDGTAIALEDRCCHRQLPLSCGRIIGDRLRCGYHGLEFDATGACVAIPGQSKIPPGASVSSWPLLERYGFVWIWPGDPSLAHSRHLPDWWWADHPDWAFNPGALLHIACNYQLIVDNLLDLSHLAYVHQSSLGNAAVVDFPVKTRITDDTVRMKRWIKDRPPPPLFRKAGRFPGHVDRWQIVETTPPSHTVVYAGCGPVRTEASGEQKEYEDGIHLRALNAPTPETGLSTWYFYGHAWDFRIDDPRLKERMYKDFYDIFLEDAEILEAQQRSLDRAPEKPLIDISVDAPALAARRALAHSIAAERKRESNGTLVGNVTVADRN